MKKLDPKNAVLAALLGIIGISSGISLATALETAVGPPIQTLPWPVVNITWSLVFFYLVKNDVRVAYYGTAVLAVSVLALPVFVFFGIIGTAPKIVPAHFLGQSTDAILALVLFFGSLKALKQQ
jgi:hypothetical protein